MADAVRGKAPTRRRRKRKNRYKKFVVMIIAILVLALAVFLIVKALNKKEEPEIVESESQLSESVTVNGVNITGMGETEALKAIEKKTPWSMKVTMQGGSGGSYDVPNLVEPSILKVLDEIFSSGQPEKSEYTVNLKLDEDTLNKAIAEMEAKWNTEAVNGSVSAYNKETETFTYSGEVPGFAIDSESIKSQIRKAVESGNYKENIKGTGSEIAPEINEETAKELYTTIGTFTTNSTANADRNNNLNLACQTIDGILLQVGEEFSFNGTTGMRSAEKGYKAAGAYQDGELVEELGGGVCQVSSTLYNAAIRAGIQIEERHAHTYEPSYVTPGEDAMVSFDGYTGPDLRFINNSSSAIVIRAKYENRTVTVSIIGIPILKDGETIDLKSEKTAEYDVPEVVYEEDPTLPPYSEKEVTKGDQGSRWVTNIIHYENGKEVSNEQLHVSSYKGHTPKIKRNSTGTQLTESGEVVKQVETNEAGEVVSESYGPAYVENTTAESGVKSITPSTAAEETTTAASAPGEEEPEAEPAPVQEEYNTDGPSGDPVPVEAPGFD